MFLWFGHCDSLSRDSDVGMYDSVCSFFVSAECLTLHSDNDVVVKFFVIFSFFFLFSCNINIYSECRS